MRIRSTKPEFWQSETMAEFDFFTRLVLKALESYVDDNGVGKDSLTLFVTAAFPHDVEKSPEIFAQVSRSLSLLSERNLIVRYRVGEERLVYVRRWRKWQYIDKPKQGRYPRPDGTMHYREDVDETIGAGQGVTSPTNPEDSPEPPENFAKTARKAPEVCPPIQSGEQGNRGTGEQEEKSSDPDGSDPPKSDYPQAFEEWWTLYPRKDAKRKALEAWRRACRRATPQALEDGALRYAQDPNRQEQFTKQPATWLNGDCWLSDALPDTAPVLRAVGSLVDDKVNGWLDLANTSGRELE